MFFLASSSASLQVFVSHADSAVHFVVCKHTHAIPPTTPALAPPGPLALDAARASSETDARKRAEPRGHPTRIQKPDLGIRNRTRPGTRDGVFWLRTLLFLEGPGFTVSASSLGAGAAGLSVSFLEGTGFTASTSGLGSGAAGLSVSGPAPDSRSRFQHRFRMPCRVQASVSEPAELLVRASCSWLQLLCMKFQSTGIGINVPREPNPL